MKKVLIGLFLALSTQTGFAVEFLLESADFTDTQSAADITSGEIRYKDERKLSLVFSVIEEDGVLLDWRGNDRAMRKSTQLLDAEGRMVKIRRFKNPMSIMYLTPGFRNEVTTYRPVIFLDSYDTKISHRIKMTLPVKEAKYPVTQHRIPLKKGKNVFALGKITCEGEISPLSSAAQANIDCDKPLSHVRKIRVFDATGEDISAGTTGKGSFMDNGKKIYHMHAGIAAKHDSVELLIETFAEVLEYQKEISATIPSLEKP